MLGSFLIFVWACAPTFISFGVASEGRAAPADPAELCGKYGTFVVAEGSDSVSRIVYADARQHLHVYVLDRGRPAFDWETGPLGSRVVSLLFRDLNHDGRDEIVVGCAAGRIMVIDVRSHEVVWENAHVENDTLSCMTAGNIDQDPQDELIFLARGRLNVLDGRTRSLEWRSDERFVATVLVLGNADDDEQMELILNSGVILDTRFHNVEFESAVEFGDRIDLMDLTGDGYPEVIGESADGTIRVFDIYAQRELW